MYVTRLFNQVELKAKNIDTRRTHDMQREVKMD